MKKTFISAMIVVAVILSMAVSSLAVTSTASYATTAPVIDGVIDSIWDTTEAQHTVDGSRDTELCADGYTKILWDETALYFLAVITDSTMVNSSDDSCTNGVNFWVSENNTESDSFDSEIGDWLYFCSSNGITQFDADKLYIDNAAPYQVALKACVATDDGYIVEVKIPYCSKITPSAGHIIGYTCSIDDEQDGDGERDEYCYTARDVENNGSANNYWSATKALGEVELIAAPVVDNTPVATDPVDPTPTEVVPVAPTNPSTADVTAIFYALASVSAIGGLTLIGKKK